MRLLATTMIAAALLAASASAQQPTKANIMNSFREFSQAANMGRKCKFRFLEAKDFFVLEQAREFFEDGLVRSYGVPAQELERGKKLMLEAAGSLPCNDTAEQGLMAFVFQLRKQYASFYK
jgi:hypothetical protein